MVKNGHSNGGAIERVAFRSATVPDFGFESLALADVVRRVGSAHLEGPRRLEFCQLMVLCFGTAVQEVDFVRYAIRPGMVVFTRPGQVHRLVVSKDCQGLLMLFKPEFVFTCKHAVEIRDIAAVIPLKPAIANAIRMLNEEYALVPVDRTARSIIVHEAAALLLRLRRESEPASPQEGPAEAHALFRRFEALLETTFQVHRFTAMLAHQLGCSEKTLRRACLAAAGLPPKTLAQQRVALEAERILAHTDEPVKQIAHQLGFTEPTNFVKFFRRVTGELPGAFRSRARSALR